MAIVAGGAQAGSDLSSGRGAESIPADRHTLVHHYGSDRESGARCGAKTPLFVPLSCEHQPLAKAGSEQTKSTLKSFPMCVAGWCAASCDSRDLARQTTALSVWLHLSQAS
eukprot:COSAG06_NODE_40578_length_400_cov_1.521595_1_plen_110_part_01